MVLDPYALTTVAGVRAFTGWVAPVVPDSLVEDLINAASNTIELFCRRQFLSRTYREYPRPTDEGELILKQRPILAIQRITTSTANGLEVQYANPTASTASVGVDEAVSTLTLRRVVSGIETLTTIDLTLAANDTLVELAAVISGYAGWSAKVSDVSYNAYPSRDLWPVTGLACLETSVILEVVTENAQDFSTQYDEGIVRGIFPFGWGWGKCRVDYLAGQAAIPHALWQVCIELVKAIYDFGQQGGGALNSERLGPYAWTADAGLLSAGPLSPSLKARLEPFRETWI